jgi:hypothetical protein
VSILIQRPPLSARLLALLLEGLKLFAIALGCLIILALVIFISAKTGIVVPFRWAELCFWTGFLLWVICRQYNTYLKQFRFWFALLCLILIHLIAFIIVLQRYPDWRSIWYVPIVVIEVRCMGTVLDATMRDKHSRSR